MLAMQPTVLTFPAVNKLFYNTYNYSETLLNYLKERNVFLKEQNTKMYRLSTYFIGKTMPELPILLITPVIS